MESGYQTYMLRVSSGKMINYCYILVDKKSQEAAIIDPAWELDKITSKLEALGVDLKFILLTHSHNDHVDLVQALLPKYQPSVYISRVESEFYEYECDALIRFEDKDRIQLGETTITCLVTPGHTKGSSCFLLSDDIFTGDTVFIEGCGMCEGAGASPDDLFESIQKIKGAADKHVRVYPGHSFGKEPGYSMTYLSTYNIYFQLEKEDFINFRMRKNQKVLYSFV